MRWGAAEDGVFKAVDGRQVDSGETFAAEFAYGDWGGTETDLGYRQILLQVTGEALSVFSVESHPARNSPNCRNWHIVDMCGRLPALERLSLGSQNSASALGALQFFSLPGGNRITSFDSAFAYCLSLLTVRHLYTGGATNFSHMFSTCASLLLLPDLDTGRGVDFSYMFSACYSLSRIPEIDLSGSTNFAGMFQTCFRLKHIPPLTGAKPESVLMAFYMCGCLEAVEDLDLSRAQTVTSCFSNNFSLRSVTMPGGEASFAASLNFSNANMDTPALETLLRGLPRLPARQSLFLTGNPGVFGLDAGILAEAEEKNWTVSF